MIGFLYGLAEWEVAALNFAGRCHGAAGRPTACASAAAVTREAT